MTCRALCPIIYNPVVSNAAQSGFCVLAQRLGKEIGIEIES